MADSDDVTHWIDRLKAGDSAAAEALWERYFEQLVRLARGKLRGAARRVADEEDVALSAFESVCRHAEDGRFPRLDDRNNLWSLLVVFTARKARRLIKHERRLKRGGGETHAYDADLESIVSEAPTPAFAAEVAEECERLFERLTDETQRKVAERRLEGYTVEEIAAELNTTTRTIERKLRVIRSLWGQEDAERP